MSTARNIMCSSNFKVKNKKRSNGKNCPKDNLFDDVLEIREDLEWKQGCDSEDEVRESEGHANNI
jgi:hypothetical protein